MPFTPTDFEDSPSTATPITAAELDKLGTQYAQALADVPAASTTVSGKVELATSAETTTGTDTARAITPSGLTATRGLYVGINAQVGTTYAPVLADQGKLVTLSNAGAITVTLPQNSTTAFPIGTQIDFVVIGAGMATFAAGTGATVNGTPSLVTRAQYSAVTLLKVSTNGWIAVGDLA